MAGGVGSRFWPISRNSRPKQFLDILNTGKTFIRSTFERFLPVVPVENFLVVTNTAYKEIVLQEIPELKDNQVLCEPIGRNTAPCITYAAFRLRAMAPGADMIVTPSDHLILNERQFVKTINESVGFIRSNDALMTIGIKPSHPNTGYGYIQVDNDCPAQAGICRVKTFTEKPGIEMATAFFESGEFFWNSGIFIWKPEMIINAVKKALPDTYHLFDSILPYYNTPDEDAYVRKIYSECRPVSIDVGVMEKADNVHVNCSDFGWSDIGTWGALYEHSVKDQSGNVAPEHAALYDTGNCIIKVPGEKLVVIEGLDGYIVVDHGDVLMICPKGSEQNIKRYVQEIRFKEGDRYI